MMVLMIMTAYAVITPLLMPFCSIFFAEAYLMYKYQLLYVYINDYQSGGHMWYAVFRYSLVVMVFGSFSVLGYLALQLGDGSKAGPFYFLLPLPFSIMYFGHYCNHKFRKSSENLSYGFARELDHKNEERRAQGKPTPNTFFQKTLYRLPS
jgi:lysine-specific demethylase 3